MQYGLFLKGIGLTLEEALKFWRQEFSKGMGAEKVRKCENFVSCKQRRFANNARWLIYD